MGWRGPIILNWLQFEVAPPIHFGNHGKLVTCEHGSSSGWLVAKPSMAFPTLSLYGVRIATPKQHQKRFRRDLLRRVCPRHGEGDIILARRLLLVLQQMGIQPHVHWKHVGVTTPVSSKEPRANLLKKHILKGAVPTKQPGNKKQELLTKPPTTPCRPHIVCTHNGGTPTDQCLGVWPRVNQPLVAPIPGSGPSWGPTKDNGHGGIGATGSIKPLSWDSLFSFKDESVIGFVPTTILGKGSFGKVYGGSWQLGGKVALKFMPRDPFEKPQLPQGALDILGPNNVKHRGIDMEIIALQQLAHPCILELKAVLITTFNKQLYLRWYDMTLWQYLQHWPPEHTAIEISKCILKGLTHMHTMGFVHRDLKPANILIDSQPLVAVIGDLGNVMMGETDKGKATTLTVRAPELMLGHPFRKPSDIWSVGCIVAEIEKPTFFEGLWHNCKELPERAQEATFMHGMAKRMGVWRPSCTGFPKHDMDNSFLQLGAVLPGVFGKRFRHQEFQNFMTAMLDFQPMARATASQLLEHRWLTPQPQCVTLL